MEDRWNMTEVLALLEGGNGRFREFCAVTNSFPLEVDNHKEFIDRLYATVPVKAYRSLLRKSVGKVLEEHKGLIHNHQAHLRRKKSLQHNKRRHHHHDDNTVCTMRKADYKKYGKVLPMMSIYDYYTTVLKREWPLTEQQIIDQLEDSALNDLEASASELMALQQDERPAEVDGKQHDNDEKQAIEERMEPRDHQIEKSLKVEEEKKDVDGNDNGFTNANDSDPSVFSGDDPSLFGEALVSLAGDEGSVLSSVPGEPKQKEYTMALNDDEHESSSNKPAATSIPKKRRQVRPEGASLQSVPESSPTNNNADPDNDVVSVLSREEIELSLKRFNPRGNRVSNDDNQSVAHSVGSSVGDMDLKSVSDAQSVVSSDLESISEVTKGDAIAKNLEPTLTSQNSFRNLSAEPVDTSYAPNEPGVESARNIHELEASNSKLEYDEDEMPPGETPEGGSHSGGRDDRDSDKSVQFGGLPSAPPERTKDRPRGPIKCTQEGGEGDSEEAGDGLLEGFQPRQNTSEREQEDSEPPQERQSRRFPQPFNGRMGPKVVSNPSYTPQIRPSFRRGLLGGNKAGGEEKQMPRRMSQRSPSPQRAPSPQQQLASAASRVSSAYRHQVQSLARNFGRQSSRNESPRRNDIPEYNGNLAALGKVDDLSPPRVRSPSPTTHQHHQDGRNKLGSLIANSRRKLVNNTDKLSSSFRRGSVTNDF